jgi:hypothetical protein
MGAAIFHIAIKSSFASIAITTDTASSTSLEARIKTFFCPAVHASWGDRDREWVHAALKSSNHNNKNSR